MSAVTYLLAKRQPSPALLFEKARGFEQDPLGVRMLWNILGPSLKRTALSLEEPADTPTVELIRRVKEKFKTRIKPREVSRERGADLRAHDHRQGHRSDASADSAALAARRRAVCGHRRRGDHARSRQRLSQRRHLPHDGAGQAAGRALSLAGQGRASAHHPVVAEGRADPGGGGVGHRPAVHARRVAEISEGHLRVRVRRGRQRASRSPSCGEPPRICCCRPTPRSSSRAIIPPDSVKAGRTVRRVHRLLRPAGGTGAARRDHGAALPVESDSHQRADGRLPVVRAERVLCGAARGAHLGRPREAWRAQHPGRVLAPGRRRRLRHDGRQPRTAVSRAMRRRCSRSRRRCPAAPTSPSGSSRSTRTSIRPTSTR